MQKRIFVMSRQLVKPHALYYKQFKKAFESDLLNASMAGFVFSPSCVYTSVCYEDMLIMPLAYIQNQLFGMFSLCLLYLRDQI